MALPEVTSDLCEFTGAVRTDVGRLRPSNEDAIGFFTPSKGDPAAAKGSLLIVADGMGGHAAGEVASAVAIEVVKRVYFSSRQQIPASLAIAFEAANRAIFEYGKQHSECRGMGTTCTALAVCHGNVFLAHVGDSRAYHLREGHLQRLTEDQTLIAQMIRDGLMTEEESRTAGGRNILVQALGTSPHVDPSVSKEAISLAQGDIFILCSDGLWNMVDDATIARLASQAPPEEACQNLVDAALEAGGYDNVSVGVFRFGESGRDAPGEES